MPEWPYTRQHSTSIAARNSITSSKNAMQTKVWQAIKESGPRGATDEELQTRLDMNPSTQRPRRGELREAGLIIDSGKTRKTRSGCKAIVWVAKPNDEFLFS